MVIKVYIDSQYANVQCRNTRNYFLKLGSNIVQYWSYDNKKKIKIGLPSKPYALAIRTV
jgi:hypothetical protein